MAEKTVLITLVAIVAIAVVVGAFVLIRRGGQEQPAGENENAGWQPTAKYQFRSTTFISLENTGDNLPIENVSLHAPFPPGAENVQIASFSVRTLGRGALSYDGENIENTLTAALPEFWVENIPGMGQRSVIRADNLQPGDNVEVTWLCRAPENTTLYDAADNRILISLSWVPEKSVGVALRFTLIRESVEPVIGETWAGEMVIENSRWLWLGAQGAV